MARRGSARKIDSVHWTGFNSGFLALAAGSIGINVAPAQHEPETLLRTRGTLLAYVDGAQAPGGLVTVSMGLHVVPEGTGATVSVSPFTDADADWFWYATFFLATEELVTDVLQASGVSGYREVIDDKAMRRVHGASEVQLVAENTSIGAALPVNIRIAGRFLTGY